VAQAGWGGGWPGRIQGRVLWPFRLSHPSEAVAALPTGDSHEPSRWQRLRMDGSRGSRGGPAQAVLRRRRAVSGMVAARRDSGSGAAWAERYSHSRAVSAVAGWVMLQSRSDVTTGVCRDRWVLGLVCGAGGPCGSTICDARTQRAAVPGHRGSQGTLRDYSSDCSRDDEVTSTRGPPANQRFCFGDGLDGRSPRQ